MNKFKILLLAIVYINCTAQHEKSWIDKSKEQWPAIAMINNVAYKNGESYIHSSFKYAATGFLIDTGSDTLVATAKHVLWIAKTKSMNSVDLQGNLKEENVLKKGKDDLQFNHSIKLHKNHLHLTNNSMGKEFEAGIFK